MVDVGSLTLVKRNTTGRGSGPDQASSLLGRIVFKGAVRRNAPSLTYLVRECDPAIVIVF